MERILDTDLQDYKFLSGLKLLPDDRALVIAAKADLEDNCYRSDLYLVDCKTGAARPLTSHGDVRSFALFGDKSVIFPAIREKKDQKRVENGELLTVFYQLPLDGGESRECFRLPLQGASAHLVREGSISSPLSTITPDRILNPSKGKSAAAPFWTTRRKRTTRCVTRLPSGSMAGALPIKSATGCGCMM